MARNTERNYRALAIRQADFPADPQDNSPLSVATRAFTSNGIRYQEQFIRDRRARLVKAVNEVAREPRLFGNHRYFRSLNLFPVLSTDEASENIRRQLARERSKLRSGHWSAKPGFVVELGEALVFARYFRRFGQRVWLREAA